MLFLRIISVGILAVMHATATNQNVVGKTQVTTQDPNEPQVSKKVTAFGILDVMHATATNQNVVGNTQATTQDPNVRLGWVYNQYGHPKLYPPPRKIHSATPVIGDTATHQNLVGNTQVTTQDPNVPLIWIHNNQYIHKLRPQLYPPPGRIRSATPVIGTTATHQNLVGNTQVTAQDPNVPLIWVHDQLMPPQTIHSATPVIGATATYQNLVGNTQITTQDPNDLPAFDPVTELKKLWHDPPKEGIRLCTWEEYNYARKEYGDAFYIVAAILDRCDPMSKAPTNINYRSIENRQYLLRKSSKILFTKSDPTNIFQQKAKHAIEAVHRTLSNDPKYKSNPEKWVHDQLVLKLRPQLFRKSMKICSAAPVIVATATQQNLVGNTQITTQDFNVPPVSKELEKLSKVLQDYNVPDPNIVISVEPPKKKRKIDLFKQPHDSNSALSGYTDSSHPEESPSGQQSTTYVSTQQMRKIIRTKLADKSKPYHLQI